MLSSRALFLKFLVISSLDSVAVLLQLHMLFTRLDLNGVGLSEFGSTSMIRLLCLLTLVLVSTGCQRSSSGAVGGTSGVLRMGDAPLADFQVKVFRGADGSLMGTGATNWEGRFQLVTPEGRGPCWLEPGDYVCVIESFGTDAPKLSSAYGDKTKSPLKIKHTDRTQQIELRIPAK